MLGIVLFVFGIVALGLLARRLSLLHSTSYQHINDYVYYVSLPLLVFTKLAPTQLGGEHLLLVLANAAPILAMMLLVGALWKLRVLPARLSAALLISSFFGNIVYMGFPVLQMRFGNSAVAEGAIISFVYNVLIFTVGLALVGAMTGSRWNRFASEKLARNTIVWACIAGAAFSLAHVSVPQGIMDFLSSVGSTTAPLALFSMGLFLHGQKAGQRPFPVLLMCAFKLLLFPALFAAFAILLGLRGTLFEVSFLEALMPLAVTNFVIAEKFGLEKESVAQAVLASTILSIPILLGFDWLVSLVPL